MMALTARVDRELIEKMNPDWRDLWKDIQ